MQFGLPRHHNVSDAVRLAVTPAEYRSRETNVRPSSVFQCVLTKR